MRKKARIMFIIKIISRIEKMILASIKIITITKITFSMATTVVVKKVLKSF